MSALLLTAPAIEPLSPSRRGGADDCLMRPDPLMVAKEGEAPAYRGLAYFVFERLPLADFGNRIPQLSFTAYFGGRSLEKVARILSRK